jgi:hypothetical protein
VAPNKLKKSSLTVEGQGNVSIGNDINPVSPEVAHI